MELPVWCAGTTPGMQPSRIVTHSGGWGVMAAAFESQMLLSITPVQSPARNLCYGYPVWGEQTFLHISMRSHIALVLGVS